MISYFLALLFLALAMFFFFYFWVSCVHFFPDFLFLGFLCPFPRLLCFLFFVDIRLFSSDTLFFFLYICFLLLTLFFFFCACFFALFLLPLLSPFATLYRGFLTVLDIFPSIMLFSRL